MRTVLYAGSFDPVTNGHIDVLRRAAALADRVVAAIGTHAAKAPLFSIEERIAMLREVGEPVVHAAGSTFEVMAFEDLAVEAARRAGAAVMVRGLRDATDFDYEMQMAGMNAALASDVETVFLPASSDVRQIAATLVRQIAAMGGDVSAFVPPQVAARLAGRARSAR